MYQIARPNLVTTFGQGYPPLIVPPEDRAEYIDTIEKYQLHAEPGDYQTFMLRRLSAALDDYFCFLEPEKE